MSSSKIQIEKNNMGNLNINYDDDAVENCEVLSTNQANIINTKQKGSNGKKARFSLSPLSPDASTQSDSGSKKSRVMDNAQKKLDTAQSVSSEILEQAKKDSDKLVIELNDKFHKTSEIKKNLAENKIGQMKEAAIQEIKDASIKIAVDSVKKIITTSVDKSKLDTLFNKNLDETKEELKKINL